MQGFIIVAPLVILMTLGAVLRRTGFLVESDVACMAKLIFWLVSPAVLFRGAMQLEMDWSRHVGYAAAMYGSAILVAIGVYLFGRFVLCNAGGKVLPVSVLSSFRSNSIMVGIPVVMLAMGDDGLVPIAIYFAVTEVGYNLLSIMGAEFSRGGAPKLREQLPKALRGVAVNPLIWASLSGLIVSAFGFHALPGPLATAFTMITNMAGGISILMIGASLDFSKIGRNLKQLLPDCAVRLLIHPALLYAFFRVFQTDPPMMQAAMLITAAPAPNIAFVFAKAMGFDAEYGAGLIGITTVAFVVTMPVWLNILGLV